MFRGSLPTTDYLPNGKRLAVEDIGGELNLIKLKSEEFQALRSQYMNYYIKPGSEMLSISVTVGGKLIGVYAFAGDCSLAKMYTYIDMPNAYLLSDFDMMIKRLNSLTVFRLSGNGKGYWTGGKGLECISYCQLIKLGWSDKQIANDIGITTATLYNWKRKDKTFAELIDKLRLETKVELEKSILELALGKTYTEEIKSVIDPNTGKIIRIEKTKKQLPPNANLQILLAKKMLPEKYQPLWSEDDAD